MKGVNYIESIAKKKNKVLVEVSNWVIVILVGLLLAYCVSTLF